MFTFEVILTLVVCVTVILFAIFDMVDIMRKLTRAARDNVYQPQPTASIIRQESGRSTVVVKNINNEDADELLRLFREGREQRGIDVSSESA
jgi:hypothetical protein